ncbi:hypothetical protein C8J27_11078 [Rhodobacter aestuarii]|uniref:Mu-like prophage I protein n=1 Tax=Rhodobacter aestuarii TaxID=453582 RepID=A0A1N7Q1F3_9RHOB|nr:hypothetical protein [Rhodobacter aestuarii]PTV94027.1 hypothetical protein C8J27_11078 [Rhodobacter aestuarii]SIT16733.1 hypothetical protein SAMN05421580_11278 [Rhodobacter aestuarii]
MSKPITARIEVFRPGTFTPMAGDPITYSAGDLRAIADAYDPETAPAPIVVGHPETDAPAYGWIKSFHYDQQADRLVAELHEIEPQFAELVKGGRFKKVSMSFFSPGQPHNPVPGTWYPKHVGFLGAAAPAVSGLRNAQFAGVADAVFTASFGAHGFEETASVLRTLRDFLIEKFGMEDADKALPPYRLEWLGEMELPAMPEPSAFAEQTPLPLKPEKDPPMSQPDPAFAAREADLAAREKAIAAREAKTAHDENAAFAEALVTDGKLLPASKDQTVAVLDALPKGATVAFAEGGQQVDLAKALRDILSAQPKIVQFGETDLGADPDAAKPASFAADGKAVDAAALATHQKALAYQRANPGTDYLTAVRTVS